MSTTSRLMSGWSTSHEYCHTRRMEGSRMIDNLDDLDPIQIQVFPYAVRYTRYWLDDAYYYKRYTTLTAAKGAANHKVADKPTTIFEFDFVGWRWAETEFHYD